MLMPRTTDDLIPPHRLQHQSVEGCEVITYDSNGRAVRSWTKRVTDRTALDRYLKRGQIDEAMFKAGERLQRDWYLGRLESPLVPDLTGTRIRAGGGGGLCSTERREHHWRLWVEALGEIADDLARRTVVRVCCEDRPAGKKGEMNYLRFGLGVLARKYGY